MMTFREIVRRHVREMPVGTTFSLPEITALLSGSEDARSTAYRVVRHSKLVKCVRKGGPRTIGLYQRVEAS